MMCDRAVCLTEAVTSCSLRGDAGCGPVFLALAMVSKIFSLSAQRFCLSQGSCLDGPHPFQGQPALEELHRGAPPSSHTFLADAFITLCFFAGV